MLANNYILHGVYNKLHDNSALNAIRAAFLLIRRIALLQLVQFA
jgi:hypothetical protein